MKKLLIGILLSALTFSTLTFSIQAQENVPEPSKAPLAAMQKLAPMTGVWSAHTEYSADNGANWQTMARADVEFSYQLKNLVLAEAPDDHQSSGFQTATFFSYDQYRKIYRIAVMDDTWGIMDIYEGDIENDKLVVTNLRSKTFFPIDEKTSRAFRLTIDISGASARRMEIDKSDDGGKSWQPNFVVSYTKK